MTTRFSTFTEGDECRTFAPSTSMYDAVRKVRNDDADGMTVDVINDSGDVCISYDVQAGRPIVAYYGDECH